MVLNNILVLLFKRPSIQFIHNAGQSLVEGVKVQFCLVVAFKFCCTFRFCGSECFFITLILIK